LKFVKVGRIVTDAVTGAPIVGTAVTVAGVYQTMSVTGGIYLTPLLSNSGQTPILIGKTGYDYFFRTVTLVTNTTATQDAALWPIAVQPGTVTAVANNPNSPAAVTLTGEFLGEFSR